MIIVLRKLNQENLAMCLELPLSAGKFFTKTEAKISSLQPKQDLSTYKIASLIAPCQKHIIFNILLMPTPPPAPPSDGATALHRKK